LASVQYFIFIFQHEPVDFLQKLSHRGFIFYLLSHLSLVDFKQLLISAIQIIDKFVHPAQLLIDLGHFLFGGEIHLLLCLPLLDALVQLDHQLLYPHTLLVDYLVLLGDRLGLLHYDFV
jgi:hypothetical protein